VAALPLVTHTHQCLTLIHMGQASTAMQTACHAGGPMTGAESGRGMIMQVTVTHTSGILLCVDASETVLLPTTDVERAAVFQALCWSMRHPDGTAGPNDRLFPATYPATSTLW
jgi:hypothetical protein